MKKGAYPPDWKTISRRVREKAGWKCEVCGLAHGAVIMRSTTNGSRYIVLHDDGCWHTPDGDLLRVTELPMEFDDSNVTKVVITVHHKGVAKPDGSPGSRHDKMDCRDENLSALCQRCHLLADMDLHIIARKITRRRNKRIRRLATGQLEFWKD